MPNEEEIIDIFKDQVPVLSYSELIKQENIFRYPRIIGGILQGGEAIIGSENNVLRFKGDIGLWMGNATFALAPFRVTMAGTITAATITGGSFQTAASGARVTVNAADNYIRIYDSAGNQRIAVGASLDATDRLMDISSETTSAIRIVRFFAQHLTDTNIVLQTINKGCQIGIQIYQENIDSYRTTNSTPMLDFFQLGTGSAIRFVNNNPDSDGKVFDITQNKIVTTEPIFKIAQNAIISTNFRKILNETVTGCTIWISNGTTPNGNLSGQAGDICLNGDGGNIYRCSVTGTTWVAM